jgi:hypothetical protein
MRLLFVLLENFSEPFLMLDVSSIGGIDRVEKNMPNQKSQSQLSTCFKFMGELKN